MKNSQILEKFFEQQHKQWKKECYAIFKPESRMMVSLSTPKDTVPKEGRKLHPHSSTRHH